MCMCCVYICYMYICEQRERVNSYIVVTVVWCGSGNKKEKKELKDSENVVVMLRILL